MQWVNRDRRRIRALCIAQGITRKRFKKLQRRARIAAALVQKAEYAIAQAFARTTAAAAEANAGMQAVAAIMPENSAGGPNDAVSGTGVVPSTSRWYRGLWARFVVWFKNHWRGSGKVPVRVGDSPEESPANNSPVQEA